MLEKSGLDQRTKDFIYELTKGMSHEKLQAKYITDMGKDNKLRMDVFFFLFLDASYKALLHEYMINDDRALFTVRMMRDAFDAATYLSDMEDKRLESSGIKKVYVNKKMLEAAEDLIKGTQSNQEFIEKVTDMIKESGLSEPVARASAEEFFDEFMSKKTAKK